MAVVGPSLYNNSDRRDINQWLCVLTLEDCAYSANRNLRDPSAPGLTDLG
jgi:hypothetical protein